MEIDFDGAFAQAVVAMLEQQQNDYNELKRNLDGMKVRPDSDKFLRMLMGIV